MIDWHTHILPKMDDGSKNLEESIQMLLLERRLGIRTVVLTPHFYASAEDEASFLERRTRRLEKLVRGMEACVQEGCAEKGDFPRLVQGAEVYLFEGMHMMRQIDDFTFGRRRYMLIEMPFASWTDHDLDIVYKTMRTCNVSPVMAHVNRYVKFKGNAKKLDALADMGAIFQINTEAFYGRLARWKTSRLMNRYGPVVLGSDCHNMEERIPDWDAVAPVLEQKPFHRYLQEIERHS